MPDAQFLLLFSVPILMIVCVQALLSQAYANWAASAYVAGTLLVVPWLLGASRRWLYGSMAFNLTLVILLPLSTVIGTGWRGPDGALLLERYLGRTDMSRQILQAARAESLDRVVADDRDILADLMYSGRDADIAVFARPRSGRAPNHYVLKHALPAEQTGAVLLVTKRETPPRDCEARPVRVLDPPDGAYAERPQKLFVVPAECLAIGP